MSSSRKSKTLKSKKSKALKSKKSKTLKSRKSKALKSRKSKALKSKRSPKGVRVKDINNSDYAPMKIVHKSEWDDKDFIPYFKYINPYPDDTIDKKYVYIKMNDGTYEGIKLKGLYNSEFEYNGRAYDVSFGFGVIKNDIPTIFHDWKKV
jgi:hypothetical protein